jgi:hypothetical protein
MNLNEWQPFINAGGLCIMGALGWFARELWDAVKDLKSDLAKLREELPKTYVAKDDFVDFKKELMQVLNRIEDKLDHKQDK